MDGVLTKHEALALGLVPVGLPAGRWSGRVRDTSGFVLDEVRGEGDDPKFRGVVALFAA